MTGKNKAPFWKTKKLDEMSRAEWESLCDGCARCCMVKLEEEETAELFLTRLSCKMLDTGSCRCSDYPNRFKKMHDCVEITPEKIAEIAWLPETCGYRVVKEGRDLAWWHPLVSGSPETVHEAGISVKGWALNEAKVKEANYHRYIVPDYCEK